MPHAPHDLFQDTARLVEIEDGVHVYLQSHSGWCVSNAGVLAGRRSTTLVDCTATERRALGLKAAVAELTPHPVTRVVITHHHGDHHYGASLFTPQATVIAHEEARSANLLDGLNLPVIWPEVQWGAVRPMEPDVTFRDRLTLHLDDRPVELVHYGPAHTTGDLVVWLPDTRVLFAGDLTFSGTTPFVMMGSVTGCIETLEQLAALDPAVVVSGHGPVQDASVIATNLRYLRLVLRLAQEGRAAGLTPLQVAQDADLGEFADLPESERLVANLHRAYHDLAGGVRGERLAIPPVLRDMITCNGGAPLRCLA
ncbi:MBL fold metallo-hydrolase [Kitasatospora arboriphila]|uniref:MBL fold metallo-hydrolase n=1 Tax=Kitasatospora arboriphila TaxID=258052 RepID=A0ABN1TBQ0_9ACTN